MSTDVHCPRAKQRVNAYTARARSTCIAHVRAPDLFVQLCIKIFSEEKGTIVSAQLYNQNFLDLVVVGVPRFIID